ncbi:MAG: sulfatase-like hydrolase/transferase [Phycisphaeraceae bacterium]
MFAIFILSIQSAHAVEIATKTKRQPNIVLIMADDLGYGSLGCYGGKEFNTPHIDRLAKAGMLLTDFHSNGPMCTPTRAALMTGRYPQRCAWVDDAQLSPVFQNQRKKNIKQRWAWGISLDELTIAEVLNEAGYRTGLIGKWHLGYDFKFHPMNQGFDEFRGFIAGGVDYHSHIATSGLKELDWWDGKEIKNETGYSTDLLTRYANDFIIKHKDEPFFLYLAHASPHTPLQGRNPNKKQSAADTYKEMIEILDESVGSVVQVLREHDLEGHTLLVFCSDNGAASPSSISANGILRGKKGSMFEGGHRVPFIATWPGVIPSGTTNDQIVMTMDFFSTFTKLAQAQLPAGHSIDGIDLMPTLTGQAQKSKRTLHWLFGDSWAVRRGVWKLIGRGKNARQLINLHEDPTETGNHLRNKSDLADEMKALHNQWIKSVGDK